MRERKLGEEMTKAAPHNKGKKPIQDPQTGVILVGVAQDTNKNGTAGRPTDYREEYCDMLIKFFQVEEYQDMVVNRELDRTEKPDGTVRTKARESIKRVANKMPTLERFADNIGVIPNTLWRWANERVNGGDDEGDESPLKHPEFRVAYDRAKNLQKNYIIQVGMQGLAPSNFAVFVAKNVTDMTDVVTIKKENMELEEKRDALSDWFDTLQQHVQPTTADNRTD